MGGCGELEAGKKTHQSGRDPCGLGAGRARYSGRLDDPGTRRAETRPAAAELARHGQLVRVDAQGLRSSYRRLAHLVERPSDTILYPSDWTRTGRGYRAGREARVGRPTALEFHQDQAGVVPL